MSGHEWKVGDRALMWVGEVTLTAIGHMFAEYRTDQGSYGAASLLALRPAPARTHSITLELPEDEVRVRANVLRQNPAWADPGQWVDDAKANARINAAILAYAEEHGL